MKVIKRFLHNDIKSPSVYKHGSLHWPGDKDYPIMPKFETIVIAAY